MVRIPSFNQIKNVLSSPTFKYGLVGAASLPLIDYVLRKYVPQIPATQILPQLPTLDSWIIDLGVPAAIVTLGVASNSSALTYVGVGTMLAGITLLSGLTLGLNLALLPVTVQRGAIATTQALARRGY